MIKLIFNNDIIVSPKKNWFQSSSYLADFFPLHFVSFTNKQKANVRYTLEISPKNYMMQGK
jgi:hypothetical protein